MFGTRKRVLAGMLVVSLFATGCIGPFTLSRGLGRWNANVGNKWGAEAVFLGLVFLHVYQIAGLIDLIIVNPFYFWKAPNSGPMFAGRQSPLVLDGIHRVNVAFSKDERTLRADLYERDRWIDTIRIIRMADGSMTAENSDGRVHYRSTQDSLGIWQAADDVGRVVFSFFPEFPSLTASVSRP